VTEINKHSKEFRERFLKVLERIDCDALYFSGGMDSTTILFGLLELGRKPFLVSFKQKDIESKDHIIGTKIANHYNLKRELVETKTDKEGVLKDIDKVISLIKYPTKVHIQCCIPFIYMSEKLKELGYTSAFTGLSADDIFGNTRKYSMHYREFGDEGIIKYRMKELFDNPKLSDYDIRIICESFNIKMIDPYRDGSLTKLRENSLLDYLLKIPFKELHWKKQKSLFYHAFLEYWKDEWYHIGNLQVVSGLRETHDKILLEDPTINNVSAKAVIKIYKELIKKHKNKSTLDKFIL